MDLTVSKGGVCWAEFILKRCPKGLDFTVRVLPEVEELIKSLTTGKKEPAEAYGMEWFPIEPAGDLMIYRTDKRSIEGDSWTIDKVAQPLLTVPDPRAERDPYERLAAKKVNMSFLRIAGLSNPNGVRFGIHGPFSKDFIKQYGTDIIREMKNLVQQYIVPVNINLRIVERDL